MRPRITLMLGLALTAPALIAGPAAAELTLPRPSPKASVTQTIGLTDFTVTYSRPGVKNRTIWGDLVPYGEVWRTGANEATTFECSDDIEFEGEKLKAGKYALFTMPGRNNWTVFLSTQHDLWGTNERDPKKDVLKVVITPTYGPEVETMGLGFENIKTESGQLVLRWDKLVLPINIKVDAVKKALASAETEMAKAKPDDWRTPFRAASFLLDVEMHLDKATKWAEQSVKANAGYLNLSLLAKLYAKTGKKDQAIAQAEKAIEAGKANKSDTRPTEKLLAEWKGGSSE